MGRVDTEVTVEELRGCLDALSRHTAESLILLDPDGVICLWNPAAEGLYGYRAAEMLGRADTFLIPSDRLRETEDLRRRALEGETVAAEATRRLTRSGQHVDVHLTVCPLFDGDGQAIGLVEISHSRDAPSPDGPPGADEEAWESADGEIERLLARLPMQEAGSRAMVGAAPALMELRRQIGRLGPTEATVLILGESGTGKELVAHALHAASHRAARPLVAVNCASIPRDLLESDLFGHERGAFTGAFRRKVGRLEAAAGGTVFLDEICEMPLELQPKLLRVLEERMLTRVGGLVEHPLDVRFLAATNRPIERCVRDGTFREDLYYRLGTARLVVPPLRERLDDLEPLSEALLERIGRRHGRPAARLSADARLLLRAQPWPGNVRQLANVLEQALLVADDGVIDVPLLEPLLDAEPGPAAAAEAHRSLEEVEAEHIRRVLEATRWHKTEAARILGIGRDTLYRKMRRHGLDS